MAEKSYTDNSNNIALILKPRPGQRKTLQTFFSHSYVVSLCYASVGTPLKYLEIKSTFNFWKQSQG